MKKNWNKKLQKGKKALVIFLCAGCIFVQTPKYLKAEDTVYDNGIYQLTQTQENTLTVSNYLAGERSGETADLIIPAIYQGMPVTQIGQDVFAYTGSVGTESTTANYAFMKFAINAENGMRIENRAFKGIRMLDNNSMATIDGTVDYIGRSAFENTKFSGGLKVNANIRQMDSYAFKGVTLDTGCNFYGSVPKIGNHAFENADLQCDVTFHSVEEIGDYAFSGSTVAKDKRIYVDGALTKIGDSAFENVSGVFQFYEKDIKTIGKRAFMNTKIGWATGAYSLERIGEEAFKGTGLREIQIYSRMKEIGENAFPDIEELEIILATGVTDVSNFHLEDYQNLTVVVGPDSPVISTLVGMGVKVSIRDVSEYDENEKNYRLEHPSEDPTDTPSEDPTDTPTEDPTDTPTEDPTDTPTEDPTDTPSEAPTDTPTEAPTDNPSEDPTDTPSEAPTDNPSEDPTDNPTEGPTDNPTEDPTDIPTEDPTDTPTVLPTEQQSPKTPEQSVTAQQESSEIIFTYKKNIYRITGKRTVSFIGASSEKIKKLTIPSEVKYKGKKYKVTTIEKAACKSQKYLKTVTIGDKVEIIGENAFYNCRKLKCVKIGTGLKTIKTGAFGKNSGLKELTIYSLKLKKIEKGAFKDTFNKTKGFRLYAKSKKLKKYEKLIKNSK